MEAVKCSPDYHEISGMIEPDPTDSTVSKRQWEWSVQVWRKALRDDVASPIGHEIEDLHDSLSIDDVVMVDSVQWLCGYWVDQTGSCYNVTRSGEHSFDVFTMRPTGDSIYTKGLIKARGDRVLQGALHSRGPTTFLIRLMQDEEIKPPFCKNHNFLDGHAGSYYFSDVPLQGRGRNHDCRRGCWLKISF